MSPMPGIEACPASPTASTSTGQVPFSPTATSTMRRPSARSKARPPPSLRAYVVAMSGRSFTSQFMPTSAEPSSSSATITSSRSPRPRHPERASEANAAVREATSFFMSTAPRPHRTPSSSTTAANGGCVQSRASAGTTSRWPTNASDGPPPVPRSRATRLARRGSRATSSTSAPQPSRCSASTSAAAVSFPLVESTRIRRTARSTASVPRAAELLVAVMAAR